MYLNLASLGSLSSEHWSTIIPSGSTANGPHFSSTDEQASPKPSAEIGTSRKRSELALVTPTVANAVSAKSASSITSSYLHESNHVVPSTSTGIEPHSILVFPISLEISYLASDLFGLVNRAPLQELLNK